MAGLLASIIGLFGCGQDAPKDDKKADTYRNLRQQVLTLDPAKIGLQPVAANQVWGMLMETAYPEAVVSLVTIADGTVSLYYSNGGGIIGLGGHDEPRKACEAFLAFAPKFVSYADRTEVFPLPSEGHTRFYFFTFNGILTADVKEDDLGNNRSPLSPLFHKGHEVIATARFIDEKLKADKK
jgi:hypothetical protein